MRQKIEDYIRIWEMRCYSSGIPNECPPRLSQLNKVPSYKQICSAILKNDSALKTLGFSSNKGEVYSSLKRVEIEQRINAQQDLFS